MKVFGVDYPFLSCGSVFTDGLAHAAADLGVEYAHARWDDPYLTDRIEAFKPDLLFVVHGRGFAQRFGSSLPFDCETAVWLLDEPYEVDDTSSWSTRFDHVFVSDPATLHRHQNASYLPVCYDPRVHTPCAGPRSFDVGFIGGGNPTRDRYLGALADAGLLTYVVGGAWSHPGVNAVCRSPNVSPAATSAFYRNTRIVVNVFRETHHFNREGIAATSLNPRVYEATACGCLVVSEWRPEVETLVPEMPTFRTDADCVEIVRGLLDRPARAEITRAQSDLRLQEHTYAARLQTVLARVGVDVAA
jgi:spore maturation protein CgeB